MQVFEQKAVDELTGLLADCIININFVFFTVFNDLLVCLKDLSN